MPTRCKLIYLAPASHDFQEIVKFHAANVGVQSARKAYVMMRTRLERLRDFPLMGQTHPDPLLAAQCFRKLVLNQTYVAIYKVEGDTVYIYRIVNGAMDYPKLLY